MAPPTPAAAAAAKGKGKRAGDSSVNKYSKPSKKVKPELTKDEKLRKKWRSLKDQVLEGFLENAYKTSKRILELDPESEVAQRTHIQILLNLDRYKDALAYITSLQGKEWHLEHAYALYKLGKVPEAATILETVRSENMQLDDEEEDHTRSVDVLDAQIKYRLEQFDQAQALYEDLLATTEADTPEYADLSTNLAACNEHISFIQSIPSRLGDMSSQHAEHRLPSIEELETTPIFPYIAAHPAYKTRVNTTQGTAAAPSGSTSTSTPGVTASKSKLPKKKKSVKGEKDEQKKKPKTVKLPPSIAALPENQRPTPDPERWLPKRERKGYAEILAAKEREKEKRRLKARKKLEATLTQGAASAGPEESSNNKNTSGQSGGGGAKSKNKKKKGGR